jgi:predicted PurR-regulated permease PerM
MILAIVGTFALLGLVAFLEWKGNRRPVWHWVALVIAMVLLIGFIALSVGEYLFEK